MSLYPNSEEVPTSAFLFHIRLVFIDIYNQGLGYQGLFLYTIW